MHRTALIAIALALLVPASPASASASRGADTEVEQPVGANRMVSVTPGGRPPHFGPSSTPDVSTSRRYVVFPSQAHLDHTIEPPPRMWHIYLRDRRTRTTTAIDVRPDGQVSSTESRQRASVSSDGRFVAFESKATDLASPATGVGDVFIRDTVAGTTRVVSVAADGGPADQISVEPVVAPDGSAVFFMSYATNLVVPGTDRNDVGHIYRHDLTTGETTLISRTRSGDFPNGQSDQVSVSADGNVVAFRTYARNLVRDGAPDASDIVLYDVATERSVLVNHALAGELPDLASITPDISADGSVIVYSSRATNLVPDDTNGLDDVFRFDVSTGTTTMISRSSTGGPTDGFSTEPTTDHDGAHIAYKFAAQDPDHGEPMSEVFVYDVAGGLTSLVSHNLAGESADNFSEQPRISDDGSTIVYASHASDLVHKTRRSGQRVYAYRVF